MIRTFLAFDLPEEARAVLRQAQRCLIDQGIRISWVRPENIHLTVKFLGEISEQAVERVCLSAAASTEKTRPMDLAVKGLGVFPDARRPRVVWAGLTGATQSLIDFQAELEENLAVSGFAKEPRPFKAHLTLGRVKHAIVPEKLVSALDACARFSPRSFPADRLILFRSDLKPNGAVYTVLKTFPLSGGE
ncbi:MAG: RNA 2',3'-cyclic phosphodiesterase [Thermodesulfobacteriota bacterium]